MEKPTVARKKIGLLFLSSYSEWAGGTIYILNLIRALNFLRDDLKPEILLFHGYGSPMNEVRDINYPYIYFHQANSPNKLMKVWLRAKRLITRKSAFYNLLPEIVYPYNPKAFLGKTPIHWIPDFQERYLPEMFSEAEIAERRSAQSAIASSGEIVVFSSNDAMKDFNKFYPDHHCDLRLLRFASILPRFDHLDITDLKTKFDIGKTYFMSPNQFWKHKNHKIVLEAIALLKDKNLDFQVAFTGSNKDHRNKEYFQTLQHFIEKEQIQKWIRFLGFIDRAEQLSLMNHATAIIQPSLFEGWSTVVEDSKALNQYIILSDLSVHKEQANENCIFFNPRSAEQLALIIERSVSIPPLRKQEDYSKNIQDFAHTIIQVLDL
ncbi:glycosyltransferase family 4 protein [Dyadobacter pollutisoli]|uniref:Glycosyltransferase family 1 protein n=1 Tax=Dyadobacter pollutisoli TaxID=2910158 RepID=A0A9E8NCV4_9BACT|nr:glycosyltransferase family 1 protein [Dyadobacter pollutisoli]WAC11919.1 glycosyltransferase family 1 protein [Dyadobacter pollutisoli]